MRNRVLSLVVLLAVSIIATAQQPAPSKPTPPPSPKTNLKVGDPAPDFTLPSTVVGQDGKTVRYKLSDFKGKKNVVLAFYILAFTGG